MSEFIKNVVVPDQQPTFPFIYKDVEYRIWCWLIDGTEDVYRLYLSKPVPSQGGNYDLAPVVVKSVNKSLDSFQSIKQFIELVFLPAVAEYFLSLDDEGEMSEFPEGGSQKDMFNWFIENGFVFADGSLSLNV